MFQNLVLEGKPQGFTKTALAQTCAMGCHGEKGWMKNIGGWSHNHFHSQ
jgi:hypothetical protein